MKQRQNKICKSIVK